MSNVLIKFETAPPVGTELLLDAQVYLLVGIEPHRRVDGSMTVLLVWQGECAQCRAPFYSRTPLAVCSVNRRCEAHKRPGTRPGGKRRGKPISVGIRAPFGLTGSVIFQSGAARVVGA